jgi:predicted DCC family thiol-disulfide oxidoreductase YuxK
LDVVTADTVRPYTVIYDGQCGMCQRLVKRLEILDTRHDFEVVSSQESSVLDRFPWIPQEAYAESLQLVRQRDARTWQGAAAVEEILSRLRAGRWVSWLFSIPFGRHVADRLYRWFADHRHELGCGEHCRVQAPASAVGE